MTTRNSTSINPSNQVIKRPVYEVGYNSKREHRASANGKITPSYKKWRAMMQRCYDQEYHERQPTYIGCYITECWHDFQDFADWYKNNPYYGLGYSLDKDLLIPNNKKYSPNTCCFVPQELNNLIVDNAASRGLYPQGVMFDKDRNKFKAQITMNSKNNCLGRFKTAKEAHEVYKATKERHVKNMALKWANRIEWDVFVALMNWTVKS